MDHGHGPWYNHWVDTLPISKFKATCLATLEGVRRTGRPLRVTRFGKPIADIVPSAPSPPPENWLGAMVGTAEIVGDITVPSSQLASWKALK